MYDWYYRNKFLASANYFHRVCTGHVHLISKIITCMHARFTQLYHLSALALQGASLSLLLTRVTVNTITRFGRGFNCEIVKKNPGLCGRSCASVIYKQKMHNSIEHTRARCRYTFITFRIYKIFRTDENNISQNYRDVFNNSRALRKHLRCICDEIISQWAMYLFVAREIHIRPSRSIVRDFSANARKYTPLHDRAR